MLVFRWALQKITAFFFVTLTVLFFFNKDRSFLTTKAIKQPEKPVFSLKKEEIRNRIKSIVWSSKL